MHKFRIFNNNLYVQEVMFILYRKLTYANAQDFLDIYFRFSVLYVQEVLFLVLFSI